MLFSWIQSCDNFWVCLLGWASEYSAASVQDSRGRLVAARFPEGIERAVQDHRAASMALPDAHNPSQASFPGDSVDSAALAHPAAHAHAHSHSHSHSQRARTHHLNAHQGEHLSVTSQPTNPSSMYEHDRKFAYQSQMHEDQNYALALAHEAPSSELPVVGAGVLPHSILLSSKLSSARRGHRAYILIPPMLNAILLGGALLLIFLFFLSISVDFLLYPPAPCNLIPCTLQLSPYSCLHTVLQYSVQLSWSAGSCRLRVCCVCAACLGERMPAPVIGMSLKLFHLDAEK